jgi:hypothetical protein
MDGTDGGVPRIFRRSAQVHEPYMYRRSGGLNIWFLKEKEETASSSVHGREEALERFGGTGEGKGRQAKWRGIGKSKAR